MVTYDGPCPGASTPGLVVTPHRMLCPRCLQGFERRSPFTPRHRSSYLEVTS